MSPKSNGSATSGVRICEHDLSTKNSPQHPKSPLKSTDKHPCNAPSDPEFGYHHLDDGPGDPLDIENVHNKLMQNGEMACPTLIYAALKHTSEGVTHTDRKIAALVDMLRNMNSENSEELVKQCTGVAQDVKNWMIANPIKTVCMIVGLGGTIYKAKTIGLFMLDSAQNFIHCSRSSTTTVRFLCFVALMTLRLFVSTLVPPTSPAFGIILQAATPESEKWTAMPFFLAASTIAGAVPSLIDKIIEICSHKDFMFTNFMRRFADAWPLTCWSGPTMMKVFKSVGGGKLGASLAVIMAHAAPFMGAQATCMQRYYLPHPLDVIISQPFGMSEDLISMAVAEAASDPTLASRSLTILIGGFNLAQFVVFSGCKDRKAFATFFLNIVIGASFYSTLSDYTINSGLALAGFQLVVQMLGVPITTSILSKFVPNFASSTTRVCQNA